MDLIKDINTEVEEKSVADAEAAAAAAVEAENTVDTGRSVSDYFNDARNQSTDEK